MPSLSAAAAGAFVLVAALLLGSWALFGADVAEHGGAPAPSAFASRVHLLPGGCAAELFDFCVGAGGVHLYAPLQAPDNSSAAHAAAVQAHAKARVPPETHAVAALLCAVGCALLAASGPASTAAAGPSCCPACRADIRPASGVLGQHCAECGASLQPPAAQPGSTWRRGWCAASAVALVAAAVLLRRPAPPPRAARSNLPALRAQPLRRRGRDREQGGCSGDACAQFPPLPYCQEMSPKDPAFPTVASFANLAGPPAPFSEREAFVYPTTPFWFTPWHVWLNTIAAWDTVLRHRLEGAEVLVQWYFGVGYRWGPTYRPALLGREKEGRQPFQLLPLYASLGARAAGLPELRGGLMCFRRGVLGVRRGGGTAGPGAPQPQPRPWCALGWSGWRASCASTSLRCASPLAPTPGAPCCSSAKRGGGWSRGMRW
eukprot:TRINITY_DN30648_c0_g1_i1.p2 TRINITY_DN30648_c0_g1~~TRINITY_DN30648_c0_g1_i1.p2  ORF type:complete len:456 (+),score=93.45 TRINITY_DN30648_c0_g1_i1:77-1369(+)